MSREEAKKAIWRGQVEELRQILAAGLDANSQDKDGRTLLMDAVLAEIPNVEMLRILIKAGANVNLADKGQQWTALAFSARDQRPELVRILLEQKAFVDPRDSFGDTPLWRAVYTNKGDLSVIRLLLAAGADPEIENKHGSSPRKLAEKLDEKQVLELFR